MEDGALPEANKRAVDPVIVLSDLVDGCAQDEANADGVEVVH